jgi:hypothetical protein
MNPPDSWLPEGVSFFGYGISPRSGATAPMNKLVVVSLACCVLAGCATVNEMATDKGDRAIDTTAKSILLMTVDVSRSDGSRYIPNPFIVKIESPKQGR